MSDFDQFDQRKAESFELIHEGKFDNSHSTCSRQARLSVVSGPFQSDDKSNLSFQLLQQPFISMAHSNRKWNGGKKTSSSYSS